MGVDIAKPSFENSEEWTQTHERALYSENDFAVPDSYFLSDSDGRTELSCRQAAIKSSFENGGDHCFNMVFVGSSRVRG